MVEFFRNLWQFLKEITAFGLDAFMVAASREITRRFWKRLQGRGGAIAALEEAKPATPSNSMFVASSQSRLPFLDEYRD